MKITRKTVLSLLMICFIIGMLPLLSCSYSPFEPASIDVLPPHFNPQPDPQPDVVAVVTVGTPGTLEAEIKKQNLDPLLITQLSITGKLNVADIKCIQRMADNAYGINPIGHLKHLDITGATFTIVSTPALPNRMFFGCGTLVSVKISPSITTIGSSAFSGCCALDSVDMKGVVNVGFSSFWGCQSLKFVKMPENVSYIGVDAFTGCLSLKSVEIPKKVTTISEFAFDGCTSLAKITIPQSVKTISGRAFTDCALTSVTINVINPKNINVGTGAFDKRNDAMLYVPKGSLSLYKADGCVFLQFFAKDNILEQK